jgi:tRNA dimethylallyltransferase
MTGEEKAEHGYYLDRAFFIVGPTATGKSEIAAEVARILDAEILSADAFQIYRGLDLLTAKPDSTTLAKAPHHLIATISVLEEMNAERFRRLALRAIDEIHSRGKVVVVVGGTGLYIKALTHGLSSLPTVDPKLRGKLNELSLDQLRRWLRDLDPQSVDKIDMKNRRRVVRAIEICLMTGKPASQVVAGIGDSGQLRSPMAAPGVFVFRDRDELYQRINHRVEAMFDHGVIEEVRAVGATSETASKMIGLREIRKLLEGKMSPNSAAPGSSFNLREEVRSPEETARARRSSLIESIGYHEAQGGSILKCVAQIQQATRRYAKRQLTWFRHQTNFEPLNLSLLNHKEAVKWISQRALRSCAHGND